MGTIVLFHVCIVFLEPNRLFRSLSILWLMTKRDPNELATQFSSEPLRSNCLEHPGAAPANAKAEKKLSIACQVHGSRSKPLYARRG